MAIIAAAIDATLEALSSDLLDTTIGTLPPTIIPAAQAPIKYPTSLPASSFIYTNDVQRRTPQIIVKSKQLIAVFSRLHFIMCTQTILNVITKYHNNADKV